MILRVFYIPCTINNDCVDETLFCDTTIGECQQCLSDTHCEDSEYCDVGTCVMDICSPGDTACEEDHVLVTCLSNGSGWANPTTCESGYCADGQCEAITCDDEIQNGSETALNCGGNVCEPCDNGLGCSEDSDCKSALCGEEDMDAGVEEEKVCRPVCPAEEFTGPVLLDGIYYDHIARGEARRDLAANLNQGALTQAYNALAGNDVLYYIYHGAVDFHTDMNYTEQDVEDFGAWLDDPLQIPQDFAGPVVLDMEGVWWDLFHHSYYSNNQAKMDVIIDFYIEGLEYAKALRPNALFGYWGLPKKGQSDPASTMPSIKRLLMAQDAIFVDVYEWSPGADDYNRLKEHVENTIALVEGKVPVYPQLAPRWKKSQEDCRAGEACMPSNCGMHTIEEVINQQARAALDAEWVAPDGTTCKSAGVAVWDAFVYERYCYRYDDDNKGYCAEETCEEQGGDTCANCSCDERVACNSANFCVELEYTSGEQCSASCDENCTGKKLCISRQGVTSQCEFPWWEFTKEVYNCCKQAFESSDSAGAIDTECCQKLFTVWNDLDEYLKELYVDLTALVEGYQYDGGQ